MADGWPEWPEEEAECYRRKGYWRGETLGDSLRRWAATYGPRTALVAGQDRLSYHDLDAEADRLAAGLLELGVRQGERFIVQLPNRTEFVTLLFALLRIGAVPVLAMPAHRRNEISHLAQLSEAVGYAVPDRHNRFDHIALATEMTKQCPQLRHVLVAGDPGQSGYPALADLRGAATRVPGAVRAEDLALLLLSGGTTGTPKLIPRTHDDYAYNARASAEICGLHEDSVYLAALPLAHNFTLACPGVLGTFHAGGTVVVASNPSPEHAFELMARERVTITALVPALVQHWLREATITTHDLSSLELLQVGGARLDAMTARQVPATLRCALQQVYGMAEGLINYTRLDDPEDTVCETQGRPMCPDDEIRIVAGDDRVVADGEVGELLTRGPYTVRGYYRAAEHNQVAFSPDGFYRTGDLVHRTPSGHLVVVGRVKDQINRAGDKIAAVEVEEHLTTHPRILAAALVSVPDQDLGERAVAFLVGDPPVPDVREVGRYLRERGLAAYKCPDAVEIIDTLPLTPVGKIDKVALRARITG